MSNSAMGLQSWNNVESQPWNVCELTDTERDALIISAIQVEGNWIILSRYGDDCWQLDGLPTNRVNYRRRLNFQRIPANFRAVFKAVVYRYMRRGRAGQVRPKVATLASFFDSNLIFLRHLQSLKIERLSTITPIVFFNYVSECRRIRKANGRPLSQASLVCRFKAIEALYEFSQHTLDPIPAPPWPGNSPNSLAGLTGSGSRRKQGSKTPLMPDAVFCTLFKRAYDMVLRGKDLLDLRDAVGLLGSHKKEVSYRFTNYVRKKNLLDAHGWNGGSRLFNQRLVDLRTACYIVLASTCGCRNHEFCNVQTGSHHRTENDEGTIFHWMRSKSDKTNTGIHDWMIPEAGVRALRLMERWAEPYQALIAEEIILRRKVDPLDPEIAQAQKHRHSLFLGVTAGKDNQVRTLSLTAWGRSLKAFSTESGLDWSLTSHQFRRKFANYVAHSRFGDLRYLREHFAHWSMDMTVSYAMDESWGNHLDLNLYDEIRDELEDIKLGTVKGWLAEDNLAGGYGHSIKQWKRDPANLAIFKDHQTMVISIAHSTSIRSNGHAWCTADSNACVGNTMDRTRCSNCSNAVISVGHLGIYQQLYKNLKELLQYSDIGKNGLSRVHRDLERCRAVFLQLGYDPEEHPT